MKLEAPTGMPRPVTSTILVTGASSGLGAAIASCLNARGHRVIGTGRRAPPDAGLVSGTVGLLPLDVRLDASVRSLRDGLERLDAMPNILILNAGIAVAGSLEETPGGIAEAQFQTNLFGVHRVVQAFLPHLRGGRSGRIIVIGSLAGRMPLPFQGFYSASKAAVAAYAAVLRQELAAHGITVSLVEPGDFATGLDEHRAVLGDLNHGPYAPDAAFALAIARRHEAGGGHPNRLARLIGRIVASRKPRDRYVCGSPLEHAAALLQRLLPTSWFRRLLGWRYRHRTSPEKLWSKS